MQSQFYTDLTCRVLIYTGVGISIMEQVFATIVDHESFGNYGVLIIVIGGYTQTRPRRLSNLSEKFRRLNIHHQSWAAAPAAFQFLPQMVAVSCCSIRQSNSSSSLTFFNLPKSDLQDMSSFQLEPL